MTTANNENNDTPIPPTSSDPQSRHSQRESRDDTPRRRTEEPSTQERRRSEDTDTDNKKGNRNLWIAILVLGIISIFAIGKLMVGGNESASNNPTPPNGVNNTTPEKVTPKPEPAPEPSIEATGAAKYDVPTFNPTTLLNEVNSRNVPRITRVERHVSPNGAFHLLFGKDPNSGKERIITAGGDTVTLLEPDWDVKRPSGRLVILENPPRGLTVPQGRYIVSVVE